MSYREPLTQAELYDLYFKGLATIATLVTVIIASGQYSSDQAKLLKAEEDRLTTENEALRSTVWSERIRVYSAAGAAAANVATTYRLLVDRSRPVLLAQPYQERLRNYISARQTFYDHFWGNLCLLEDRNVGHAMVVFGKAIDDADSTVDLQSLKWGSSQIPSGDEGSESHAVAPSSKGEASQTIAPSSPSNPKTILAAETTTSRNENEAERPIHADRLERLSLELAMVFRGSLMDTWNPRDSFEQLFGEQSPERLSGRTDAIETSKMKKKNFGSDSLEKMMQKANYERYWAPTRSPTSAN